MHRDHKLGLALGVLVLGFAAALCFPKQSDIDQRLLQLENAAEIDAEIARLPVHAYTNADPVPKPVVEPAQPSVIDSEIVPGAAGSLELAAGPPAPIPVNPSSTLPAEVPASDAIHSPPVAIDVGSESIVPSQQDEQLTQQYTVQPGDTLSSLAARFLGHHSRFFELFEANREILATPDHLQPGMVLTVPANDSSTSSPQTSANTSAVSAESSNAEPDATSPVHRDEVRIPSANPEPPRKFQPAGQRPFLKTQPVSRDTTLQLPTMNASASANGHDAQTGGSGRTYKVRRGDTLEGIAVREYGDVRAVEKLLNANRAVVRDPRKLKPGATLTLPERP